MLGGGGLVSFVVMAMALIAYAILVDRRAPMTAASKESEWVAFASILPAAALSGDWWWLVITVGVFGQAFRIRMANGGAVTTRIGVLLFGGAGLYLAFAEPMSGETASILLGERQINTHPLLYLIAIHLIGLAACLPERPRPAVPRWGVATLIAAPFVAAAVLYGVGTGNLRLDPVLPSVGNLIAKPESFGILVGVLAYAAIVATVEESLFRGGVLPMIAGATKKAGASPSVGDSIGIGASAGLFGMVHFGLGVEWVLASTVAGIGYGAIYWHTGRLIAPILLHAAVVFMLVGVANA